LSRSVLLERIEASGSVVSRDVDRIESVTTLHSNGGPNGVHVDIFMYVKKKRACKSRGGSQGGPLVFPVAASVSSGVG
jgi:uncharacterized protein YjhX (UPF0386 family)